MAKLILILKRVVLALLLVFLAQDAAAYKPVGSTSKSPKTTAKANNKAPASGAEHIPVEREFDKIRDFQSYDPATDKWSKIEDFETVDILEDTTEQREDRYIYHSFWAYDAVTRRWHKVDIRDYGYKLGKTASTERTKNSEEEPKAPPGFWKNWALGLRVGGGGTFYENRISHFSITERDGKFFLQTAQEETDKRGHRVHWFGKVYTLSGDPIDGMTGKLGSNKVDKDKKIVFKGEGWNIPITLFSHYTFFKRFRLGAGLELEINHLKELTPKEEASGLPTYKVGLDHEWFYNIGWFGLLGFKVIHEPDVLVDLKVGKNYNMGADFKDIFGGEGYVYNGWLVGVGLAYERRLNNYFRFLTRLSGNWKMHNDTPEGINDVNASIKLNQIAVGLELGIQVSFGKDTEEDKNAEGRDAGHGPDEAKDSAEHQKNQLKKAAQELRRAKDQRDRLGSKLRWNLMR